MSAPLITRYTFTRRACVARAYARHAFSAKSVLLTRDASAALDYAQRRALRLLLDDAASAARLRVAVMELRCRYACLPNTMMP